MNTRQLNYRAKLTFIGEDGERAVGHVLDFEDEGEGDLAEDAAYMIDSRGAITLVPAHRLLERHREVDEHHVMRYVTFNLLCEGQAKEAVEIIEEQFFGTVTEVIPGNLTIVHARFCRPKEQVERLLADCENTIACMELNTAGIYGLLVGDVVTHVAQEAR